MQAHTPVESLSSPSQKHLLPHLCLFFAIALTPCTHLLCRTAGPLQHQAAVSSTRHPGRRGGVWPEILWVTFIGIQEKGLLLYIHWHLTRSLSTIITKIMSYIHRLVAIVKLSQGCMFSFLDKKLSWDHKTKIVSCKKTIQICTNHKLHIYNLWNWNSCHNCGMTKRPTSFQDFPLSKRGYNGSFWFANSLGGYRKGFLYRKFITSFCFIFA